MKIFLKNISKNIKIIVFVTLSIGCLISLSFNYIYRKKVIESGITNNLIIQENSTKIENLNYIDSIRSLSLYQPFADNKTIALDQNGNKFLLRDLINDNVVVFRFSDQDCGSCINSELEDFFKIIDSINKKVLLFGSITYQFNLKTFVEKKAKNHLIYYIPDSCVLIKSAEFYNKPYYFILDSNLIITDIFLPIDDFPQLKANFFNFLKTIN